MMYKQYLYDYLCGHKIYCLKDGDQTLSIDASGDDDDVKPDDLRWARVSLAVNDGMEIDPDDLPAFGMASKGSEEPEVETSYIYTRQYVAALDGLCPERKLEKITFYDKYLSFLVLVFDETGKQRDYKPILLHSLPKWAKVVVTMEPMEGEFHDRFGTPDTYEIRNLAERGEPLKIVIDEYRDGELRRTRELGKDEQGEFEIITEP